MAGPLDGTAGVHGHRHRRRVAARRREGDARQRPGRHAAGAPPRPAPRSASRPRWPPRPTSASLADEGRPRAVVVAGIGTAGPTGNILATVAGPPLPGADHRAPQRRRARLGRRRRRGDRRLRLAAAAPRRWPRPTPPARRGARLVAIGNPDSELQAMAERARAPFIPVPRRAPARASLWGLTVPVLLAARASAWSRSTRPTWPRPRPGWTPTPSGAGPAPSRSSTRRSRSRSAWPARSRSSGARRRWPRWPPGASPTRSPPTPATR